MKNLCMTLITSAILSSAGLSYAQGAMPPDTAPMTASDVAMPKENGETLSDAQITTILLAANKAEVAAGKHAQKTARKKEVVDFAKQMVIDHGAASKDVKALNAKMKMKEQGSSVKDQLQAAVKDSDGKLKNKKGQDFEKAYIDEQVSLHTTVLNSIDTELTPNAKNEDLKTLLTKVRGVVSAHLDHAKQIQSAYATM